jgi:hypothetical protein
MPHQPGAIVLSALASPSDASSEFPNVACSKHILAVYERDHAQRPHVELFIQRAFSRRHGATVRTFMPTLVALEGRENRICGVAGYRRAADEALFLEHYLRCPVELELSQRLNRRVEREEIVEVGNLASLSCRAAFHLVSLLPRLLLEGRHFWVVFTATSSVRGILDRLRAPMVELGQARAERVASLGDDWGRYYENDPRVMAGYLPDGLALHRRQESE